jgi:hypothetical protein
MNERKIDEALIQTFPASDPPAFVGNTASQESGLPLDQLRLEPALRFDGGRIIRTAADALALLREHETRPGVDDRDEVLHEIERARDRTAMAAALRRFQAWASNWAMLVQPVQHKSERR